MPTVVCTGANSGIGNSSAKLLLDEGYDVHALDVNVGEKMKQLGCKTYECDLNSESCIHAFATQFKDTSRPSPKHRRYASFEAPCHTTSDSRELNSESTGIMAPHSEDSLATTNFDPLTRTFTTNTIAPLLLTQSLLPSLLLPSPPRIGLMSSRVGSISDNSFGGSYAYRASKAALNSIGKSMAVDLKEKGVVVMLMHPEFVKTGLDKSGETHKSKEAVEPEEAARKLWGVLMEKGVEESGRFWHIKLLTPAPELLEGLTCWNGKDRLSGL